MNRRGFLSGLGAIIGGIALEQAIPLGRVWSFPKEVKCLNASQTTTISETIEQYYDYVNLAGIYFDKAALGILEERFNFVRLEEINPLPKSTGKEIQMYRFSAA